MKKRKYLLPFFLVFQIVFLKLIAFFPEVVEQYYSNGLYVYISNFLRIVLGGIPFSIGDVLYGCILSYLLFKLWKTRKTWKLNWKNNLLQITSVLSVVYFVFHFIWALNYYRVPLFDKMNITREYSDTDLEKFTQKLIQKTNALQLEITHNKNNKVHFAAPFETIFEASTNGYKYDIKELPFHYIHSSKKKSLFSLPLTYMGFAGYLNPFTNEAQVNYLMPMYHSPTTSCHEMAHQMGYASESECNFIGFMASIKNNDLYFKYSGYSFALRYCLANWQVRNEVVYEQLIQTVYPGILKNYEESDAFWKAYETPIETGFHLFYDSFLKWNQQKDGIEGYSKFVNLLVNYYKNKPI